MRRRMRNVHIMQQKTTYVVINMKVDLLTNFHGRGGLTNKVDLDTEGDRPPTGSPGVPRRNVTGTLFIALPSS